jgi:hypothetical protein
LFYAYCLSFTEPLFSYWARTDTSYLYLSTCSLVVLILVPDSQYTSLVLASYRDFVPAKVPKSCQINSLESYNFFCLIQLEFCVIFLSRDSRSDVNCCANHPTSLDCTKFCHRITWYSTVTNCVSKVLREYLWIGGTCHHRINWYSTVTNCVSKVVIITCELVV